MENKMSYYIVMQNTIEDLGDRKEVRDSNSGLEGYPESLFDDATKATQHCLTKEIDAFLSHDLVEFGYYDDDDNYTSPFFDTEDLLPILINFLTEKEEELIKSKEFRNTKDFIELIERAFIKMSRSQREKIIHHFSGEFFTVIEIELTK